MKFTKICKCCGKEFETNSPQKLYCNREHWLPCPICGTLVKKTDRDFTRPAKCCSSKCSHTLRIKSLPKRKCILCGKEFIPKSGIGQICSDIHYRKCAICGNKFIIDIQHIDTMTCSKECHWKKTKQTCIETYGVDHPMKSELGQKHFHDAMMKKYGHRHALQVNKFQQKAIDTNLTRYGYPYFCLTQECVDKQTEKSGIISKINLKFAELLNNNKIPYKMEKRIEVKSYDFELLDRSILIEIDPSFTHSTFDTRYGGIDKSYHIDKSQLASKYGYRCIHIFDWDDNYKILNIIKPTKSIYARDCKIEEINPADAKKFIEDNHLQGNCNGQKIFIGLIYEKEIYQIITFGKSRYNKKFDSELLRLCTKSGYRVIGGPSKLFKYAINTHNLGNIISYCDLSKFTGDVYEKIGMKFLRNTPPQEIWSYKNNKITANLLRQRGFDQLFGANYGKGTSNNQLMLEHGWLPVYDCGQGVYGYFKKEGIMNE